MQILICVLWVVGLALIVIRPRCWSYWTASVLTMAGLCLVGSQLNPNDSRFDDDEVGPLALVFGVTYLFIQVGLFTNFQVSLRLLVAKVLVIGLLATLIVGPHAYRLSKSRQLEEVLKAKHFRNSHTHNGVICGVYWEGPITAEEFDLVMAAEPVHELQFINTSLLPEQQARFDAWKAKRVSPFKIHFDGGNLR